MAQAFDSSPGLVMWRNGGKGGKWHSFTVTAPELEAATAGREDYLCGVTEPGKSYTDPHLQAIYEEAFREELHTHCQAVRALRDGRC